MHYASVFFVIKILHLLEVGRLYFFKFFREEMSLQLSPKEDCISEAEQRRLATEIEAITLQLQPLLGIFIILHIKI